jgi:hypothetical protein
MERLVLADPGVGKKAAAVGTVEWAQHVRLTMQSIVHDLPKAPERFKGYVELCREHRAWTLMNKPDDSTFRTFEEFCEHRQPWGLGKPYAEIAPFLEAAIGKPALRLVTAPEGDGREANGANQHSKPDEDSGSKARNPPMTREQVRDRAVLRAPEPAVNLYKAGLLGQKEAAKLGPKNPTPEQAAKVTEVARAAAEAAKAEPRPKTEPERKKLQQKINAVVREALGVEEDRVAKLARTVVAFAPVDVARFVSLLDDNARRRLLTALGGV